MGRLIKISPIHALTLPPGLTLELETTTTQSSYREITRSNSQQTKTSPTFFWMDARPGAQSQRLYSRYEPRNLVNFLWSTSILSTTDNSSKHSVSKSALSALSRRMGEL